MAGAGPAEMKKRKIHMFSHSFMGLGSGGVLRSLG